jgi:hypothetical protein
MFAVAVRAIGRSSGREAPLFWLIQVDVIVAGRRAAGGRAFQILVVTIQIFGRVSVSSSGDEP